MDVAAATEGAHAAAGLAGAAAGGLGVLWLARMLFTRMVKQYDDRHKEQAAKLDAVAEKFEQGLDKLTEALTDVRLKLAVAESQLGDTRTLRSDVMAAVTGVQGRMATLGAGVESRLKAHGEAVAELREDVYVAHRRVELLAGGDTDITKVRKPTRRTRE